MYQWYKRFSCFLCLWYTLFSINVHFFFSSQMISLEQMFSLCTELHFCDIKKCAAHKMYEHMYFSNMSIILFCWYGTSSVQDKCAIFILSTNASAGTMRRCALHDNSNSVTNVHSWLRTNERLFPLPMHQRGTRMLSCYSAWQFCDTK